MGIWWKSDCNLYNLDNRNWILQYHEGLCYVVWNGKKMACKNLKGP